MSPLPRRARSLVARRSKLEDDAAKEQLRLLKAFRRDILARVSGAEGFQLFRLQTMLATVDSELRRYAPAAERATIAATRSAWAIGDDLARIVTGEQPVLWGTSPQLLQSIVDVTADETRAIWRELGSKLKSEVRRVTLGVADPFEAIVKTARQIKASGSIDGAMARAERIIRTEVNRTFSMAQDSRSREGDKALTAAGQRLVKWWLTAGDHRVRDAHKQAAKTYTKARAIPIDQPFIVNGEELMHPLDPAGSAGNTVNCRCSMLTRAVSVEEFEDLARAA